MIKSRDRDILDFLAKYKAISIKQASRLFFNGIKYSYTTARKRLKKLEEMEVIESYINKETDEKIYCLGEKLSTHNLYVLEVYSLLIENGCEILEFQTQPMYLKKQIRPDAFIKFKYDDLIYLILLEVDFTHFTSLCKFQTYEMLYRCGELQKQYGAFPLIVVVADNPIQYESNNFDTIYLKFKDIDISRILYE